MMDITDQNGNNPTEVFVGTAWQVALVQSLLENAEVKAYIYYGGHGTTASRDSRNHERAKEVVRQFYESMKQQEPPDFT